MSTYTTFFTNEPDATLLDRFKNTLRSTRYFDILIGYFRTHAWRLCGELAVRQLEEEICKNLEGLGFNV